MRIQQLAFDFEALGFEVVEGAADLNCIPGREDIHQVSICGHCVFCAKPMFKHIMHELARKCVGHMEAP